MKRMISICTGQFGDLPLETLAAEMHAIGYEGLELACHAHIDCAQVVSSSAYRRQLLETLEKNEMKISALSAHLYGQCIGDLPDPRLDGFAPKALRGKPEEIRAWAAASMDTVAQAAKMLGVKVVTFFTGSPLWAYWYSFPQTTEQMIENGFQKIRARWSPVMDTFDDCGVKLALEVHPGEIAFDYYTAGRLLETFEYRPTLGFNFDPSHLLWQGVDPVMFLRDYQKHILNVHFKDVKINRDGRAGILGSHLPFGDSRRKWNFVSLGHGDVDFDGIVRVLNEMGYDGPLAVEWEDSGMERLYGAREAYGFAKTMNFEPSAFAFDQSIKGN